MLVGTFKHNGWYVCTHFLLYILVHLHRKYDLTEILLHTYKLYMCMYVWYVQLTSTKKIKKTEFTVFQYNMEALNSPKAL